MTFDKFVKLPGSDRKPMAGAKKAAAADPNAVMQATLVLRPRQSAESEPLENIVERGDRLTREEYQARYGADPADVQSLLAFASTYGLALVRVDLGARTVTLTGKTSDFLEGVSNRTRALRTCGWKLSRTHGSHQCTGTIERHRAVRPRSRQPSASQAALSNSEERRSCRYRGCCCAHVLHCAPGREGLQLSHRRHGQRSDHRHHRAGRRFHLVRPRHVLQAT